MKILIFSDLHLHEWQYGSKLVNGVNSRLLDLKYCLSKIALTCERENISIVLFGGDLFHVNNKISPAVLKIAYQGFSRIREVAPIVALVGNHDMYTNDGSTHLSHWLNGIGVDVVDRSTANVYHTDKYGIPITAQSYFKEPDKVKFVTEFAKEGILLLHQGVNGVPLASGWVPNDVLTPEMIHPDVQCFTGHYHQHNKVSDNLTVIGSTTQQTWADVGDDRGWIIYDTETKEQVFVNSGAPRFKKIDFAGTSCCDSFVSTLETGEISNRFIKISNFTGNPEELKSILYEERAMFVDIEPYIERTKASKTTTVNFQLKPLIEHQIQASAFPEMGKQLMAKEYEIPTP